MNMEINELFNYREHQDFCTKYLGSFEFMMFNYKMNGFALKVSLLKSAFTNKWVGAWTTWAHQLHSPLFQEKNYPCKVIFDLQGTMETEIFI